MDILGIKSIVKLVTVGYDDINIYDNIFLLIIWISFSIMNMSRYYKIIFYLLIIVENK